MDWEQNAILFSLTQAINYIDYYRHYDFNIFYYNNVDNE